MTDPTSRLEVFDNPAPERDYTIRMSIPEFSCLCPKTGQPDFATLEVRIRATPAMRRIEVVETVHLVVPQPRCVP